jgi:hypothetical protein
VIASYNDPDVLAGVIDVLGREFGVAAFYRGPLNATD